MKPRPPQTKIYSRDALLAQAKAWRTQDETLVFTNGCFDILHVGHLKTLWQAKAQGCRLIVGINSDASVRALKGANRPIHTEADRALLLAGFECVDAVTIFSESTPISLLSQLQPQVHVKGGDYTKDDLPEADTVHQFGGKIVIVSMAPGHSTTSILAASQRATPPNS